MPQHAQVNGPTRTVNSTARHPIGSSKIRSRLPTGTIGLAVDDTLCHKRGAEVASEGFYLDVVWLPARECGLIDDNAYVDPSVLRDRPSNLEVLGPIRRGAGLNALPGPRKAGPRGTPARTGTECRRPA